MLVLQGTEDEIVPPLQAELIVGALRERGVPHAYLLFEGEGHGFRKAENIVRSLEAELSFYLQVLGLEPTDPLPKLEIEHLPT
jgi:dipeptidyl aminopeptidase/acylaminoacyl peptidase